MDMHVSVYYKVVGEDKLTLTHYSPLTYPSRGTDLGNYVVVKVQHDTSNARIIVHLKEKKSRP